MSKTFPIRRAYQHILTICAVLILGGSALARDIGPVTDLPLPRFVSLKASKGNVRRGPSLTHRIDWVFQRRHMPLRIIAEHGHWRRVEDREGLGGWIHYSLLSGKRTVIIQQAELMLRTRPDAGASVTVELEAGVIARLGKCGPEWCKLDSGGFRGWAPKARLWGVEIAEIRE
jgi:SH3-like domain-containing protein